MWPSAAYWFDDARADHRTHAERVFDAVWRVNFEAPGFAVLDLGLGVDSPDLRARMLDLKDQLSAVASQRGMGRFAYRSVGRFDQQVTTRFHLDGAPEQSLLMLGYEPSPITSRLAMADYTRCALELQIQPRQFLDNYNPMYRPGAALLARYVTELPPPAPGHSQIVLVNNSSLPFIDSGVNPLGVLHQAEILTPDKSRPRIINSIMLMVGEADEISPEALRRFQTSVEISGKCEIPA